MTIELGKASVETKSVQPTPGPLDPVQLNKQFPRGQFI